MSSNATNAARKRKNTNSIVPHNPTTHKESQEKLVEIIRHPKKPKHSSSKQTIRSNKKTSWSSHSPSNFLSQLQTLREFTQGCGSSFTERDLSLCLRQSNYNVQSAAEKLITGQYTKTSMDSSGCVTSTRSEVTAEKCTSLVQKDPTLQSNVVVVLDRMESESASALEFQSESVGINSCNTPSFPFKAQADHVPKRQEKNCITPRMGVKDVNVHGARVRPLVEHQPPRKKSAVAIKAAVPVSRQQSMTQTVQDMENVLSTGLLLCQRWVCGLSTCRKGSIRYKESVTISTSSSHSVVTKNSGKGLNIVRFKGMNIEGTLDPSISSFLSPLLRFEKNDMAKGSSNECDNNKDEKGGTAMIQVVAKGLMEDSGLDIGMEVPLELNVYIQQPKAFFALFDDVGGGQDVFKKRDDFWAVSNSRGKVSVMAQAAFDLLQWAQYSCVPTWNNSPTKPISSSSGGHHEREKSENSNNNTSSTSDDDNDDDDAEDDMGGKDTPSEDDIVEEDAPEWANDLYSSSACGEMETSSQEVSDVTDPTMMDQKGVHLRCYQREALRWMMHREEHANEQNSREFKEQLEFLSELASASRRHGIGACESDDVSNHEDVQCTVGPVKVSHKMAEEAKTLDGDHCLVCHPLWKRRFLWDKGADGNGKDVYCFYVNELLQIASKHPPNPPRPCQGGILADSMGLGKTVMLLALIAKDVERRHDEKKEEDELQGIRKGMDSTSSNFTTLIVTPLSLLAQWEEEIQTKSSLSCLTYYGDQAKRVKTSDISSVDVLITTYGMLQSEYMSKKDTKDSNTTQLLSLCFRRVILDEAHYIKNPKTGASKACCMVNAERRWCVTGTPISNSLQDVYGLIKFLKHEPWCIPKFWKKAINISNSINGDYAHAEGITNGNDITVSSTERVRRVLKPILLRRTKDTLSKDGKPILTLPPVETKLITVNLSEDERYFYNVLMSKSQHVFEGFIQSGTASKSWFAIFALLQRLRQSCDHLALTAKTRFEGEDADAPSSIPDEDASTKDGQSNDTFIQELLESIQKRRPRASFDETSNALKSQAYSQKIVESLTQCMESNSGTLIEECAICLEVPSTSDLAMTPCAHIFCRSCLLDSLERQKVLSKSNHGSCPICAMDVKVDDVICSKVEENASSNVVTAKECFDAREILESALKGKCSSKMLAIIHELETIWNEDPGSKVLIFSQYLGMFDLLQKEFVRQGIKTFRLDGKMSLNDRRQTVKEFNASRCSSSKNQSKGIVLLASMKACGVGMNLTAASSVFIADPWWNDAMESQCINRIHRIGQMAPMVRVRKFIVADSVEEKIVKMQHRKQGMANKVLSEESTISQNVNPTLDDLKAIFGTS